MTSFGSPDGDVLYLVVTAASGAENTLDRIAAEQAAGWTVCVVATERSLHWFDATAAAELSRHPLQTRMRIHGEPLFEPLGDRVLVTPAGLHSLAKFSLGLADDMASGLVTEAIGRRVPVTIEVNVGPGFGGHPAYPEHLRRLADAGVSLVARPGGPPLPPF